MRTLASTMKISFVLYFFVLSLILVFSNCQYPVASNEEAEDWVIEQCIKKTNSFEQIVQCIPLPEVPAEKADTLVNKKTQVLSSDEENLFSFPV